MSDELREACEKVRDLSGDIADCLSGGIPHDTLTYRGSLLHELLEASLVLQEACLAEHHADDGEPVTREWLVEIGFYDGSYPILKTPAGAIWWIEHPQFDGVRGMHGVHRHMPHIKTRSDVRRLLAALGIEVRK